MSPGIPFPGEGIEVCYVYFVKLPKDKSDELSISRYMPFFFFVKRGITNKLKKFHRIIFEHLYSLNIKI
jgi:hypothetical protein